MEPEENFEDDGPRHPVMNLPLKNFPPVVARDSPRSIGSFESPRSDRASGRGTPTSGTHPNHPANLLKQLHQQPSLPVVPSSQQSFYSQQQVQQAYMQAQQGQGQAMMYSMSQQQPQQPSHQSMPAQQQHQVPQQLAPQIKQQQQQQPMSYQMPSQPQSYVPQQRMSQQIHPNMLQRMDYYPQQPQQQQQMQTQSQGQGQGQQNKYYHQSEPQVGQKRPMPNEFDNNPTVPRKPNGPIPPGQRFPGVIPLDLSNIQRSDAGALSSERSAADLSLERSTNFFMMMPDDIVGPSGDYVRDPFHTHSYNEYPNDSMPIDSPYGQNRRY